MTEMKYWQYPQEKGKLAHLLIMLVCGKWAPAREFALGKDTVITWDDLLDRHICKYLETCEWKVVPD